MSISFEIPTPPSVNALWKTKKNGGLYRSQKYKTWIDQAAWMIVSQTKGKKVLGPFKLIMRVGRIDRRRRDLDNLLKATLDVLQHAGLIEDDRHCEWIDAKWLVGIEFTIITIEEMPSGEKVEL